MKIKIIILLILAVILGTFLLIFSITRYQIYTSNELNNLVNKKFLKLRLQQIQKTTAELTKQELSDLNKVIKLEEILKKSNKLYILVSRTEGKLYIKINDKILNEFPASLGSGKTLEYKNRKWIFKTPIRIFKVLKKARNPIWLKPDWAFIESNEPVPPIRSPLRIDRTGYLGKYGIYLGDEYLIHGFSHDRENVAGLNVTHGCIGLKEKDLEKVYNSVRLGTYVLVK